VVCELVSSAPDTYRPGAYDQLTQLATRAEVKVYGEPGQKKPDQDCEAWTGTFPEGEDGSCGRGHGGPAQERKGLDERDEADCEDSAAGMRLFWRSNATIGQTSDCQARAFHEATPVGSILLTKMDGSARGRRALIRSRRDWFSGVKFIRNRRTYRDLEPFVPTEFAGAPSWNGRS